MVPRLCLHGGQALRRYSRGDGSTRPRGHGGERLHPHPSLPPSRGKEKERGWFPVPVFTGGRLCASIDEGMGPRVREDKSGDGFPSLSSRGSGSAPAFTRGWVPASARTRGGKDFTPILAFPPPRGKEKERGWFPVSVFKGEGKREGMVPRLCLHEVRLCAGIHEGMGPRVREDTGGGRLHPHPSLPPSRGKEKERGWCGRLEGLPVAASFSSDDAAKAWGGEVSGGYCYALLRKNI